MTARRLLPVLLVLMFSVSGLLAQTDLFFSEYIEGSSNNKAIEIYNPTSSAIDLAVGQYRVELYSNGSTTVGMALNLTGTLAAHDVYVIANATAAAAFTGVADITHGVTNFNGDDALVLKKGGASGSILDVFGQVGFDPGTNWGGVTSERTLVRKGAICAGDTIATDAFVPATEWDVYPQDTSTYLGAHTAICSGGAPSLSINDVSTAEGNSGTTNFTFTVTLSAAAAAGGVTFDIGTADNFATAPSDYASQYLTSQTIPEGSSTYTFTVLVNGDTAIEPNETFFVNVMNVAGATVTDGQGQGTIRNDDATALFIHDVQGSGLTSSYDGDLVTVAGIVTGLKANGFFLQEEDGDADSFPETSEGIFVYTGGTPTVLFTQHVEVTGTVFEYVAAAGAQALTELTSPTIVTLAPAGQPLPTAVPLTVTMPSSSGSPTQLEHLEGMRVTSSVTATSPNVFSGGVMTARFFAVVTGVARPFREPGIEFPDMPPAGTGTIPPIPQWDANPEMFRVETTGVNSQPIIAVKALDVLDPVVGPLEHSFGRYAIYPDGSLGLPTITASVLNTQLTDPGSSEFTVASYNMLQFGSGFDGAAFSDRLNKASLAIRNSLRFPDVVGVQEVEDLTSLQALATKINDDAVANSQPNPLYVAHLLEGNDVGGIDVGFLVKTSPVLGGALRVVVNGGVVTQLFKDVQWPQLNGVLDYLHDRPSLVLDAVINGGPGLSFPVIVINNHLKSMIGVDATGTTGDRNRRKRQLQADQIAGYVNSRLASNPSEHIVLVGDFNAFEFNDGYADVMNTLVGTPSADDETVVCGDCLTGPDTQDGVDLVTPDLINLVDSAAGDYSYTYDGNAQNLDHVLVSQGLVADTVSRRIEHAHINADHPVTEGSNPNTPIRLSDHDPLVGYFAMALPNVAPSISVPGAQTVSQGNMLVFSIGNLNPITITDPDAGTGELSVTLSVTNGTLTLAGITGLSFTTGDGTGDTTMTFTGTLSSITAAINTISYVPTPGYTGAATLSITVDDQGNTGSGGSLTDSETVAITVTEPQVDLAIVKNGPDSAVAGTQVTYTIIVANPGPANAVNVTWTDALPAGVTFVSLTAPAGWACTTPAVGAIGTVSCSIATLGASTSDFTIVVAVDPALADGSLLTNTATITTDTNDPNPLNNTASFGTVVSAAADMEIVKDTPLDRVAAGSNIPYTISLWNNGPSVAMTPMFLDDIPANTRFVSITAPAGWTCDTPAVGETGTITCSTPTLAVGSGISPVQFALVLSVDLATTPGTEIINTVVVSTSVIDPSDPNNQSSTHAVAVDPAPADVSITKVDTPDPVTPGSNITYTITVTNGGPGASSDVSFNDDLPLEVAFSSIAAADGWTCATPAVGATGTVSCETTTLAASATAVFTIVGTTSANLAAGATIMNTASVGSMSTNDPDVDNNVAITTTTAGSPSADLLVVKTASADPVTPGAQLTYTLALQNAGPSVAANVAVEDTLPANTTFVSINAPDWSCTTPAVGATGSISCTMTSMTVSASTIAVVVTVDPAVATGTSISNTASIATSTSDPVPANDSSTAEVTAIVQQPDLVITKVGPPSVTAGGQISYTITVANTGTADATGVSVTDVLPAELLFVSATPSQGICSGTATVTCALGTIAAGGSATITLAATVDIAATVVANTASVVATEVDPVMANNTDEEVTQVVAAAADIPTLSTWMLLALGMSLAAFAALKIRA